MRTLRPQLKDLIAQMVNMEEEVAILEVRDSYKGTQRLKTMLREHIRSCKVFHDEIEGIRVDIRQKRRIKDDGAE